MTKKLLFLTLYLIFNIFKTNAQVTSTEDFETEPNGASSFINNGQTFNITDQAGGHFDIYVGGLGYGWNGTSIDNRFIDNTGTASFNIPLQLTISSSGATPFKLNSMWLFLSQSNLSSLGVGGSLTLVGKLAGNVQYTATANSGFNTSFGVANGFTLINLSNFGGQNNANTIIDQIVISTGGSFSYISVDAFTWTTVPSITATTSQTNIACNGMCVGSATVSASGGTAPYTYSWSPSGGSGATASSLCAGNYTCTITDAAAASITKNFTITQPAALAVSAASQTNVSCNGGSNGAASINIPTGGEGTYTYNWTPGNPTGDGTRAVTGLTPGNWTCTVTDANSCTATQSFTITQPTAITATTSQTNVSCNGGSNGTATVSASGGASSYTYSWSPSGGTVATASGLTAGTYTCTITDANACSITKNFTLTQPTALTATTSQTNVSCNGASNGSATVTPSGGTSSYTYSWSPSGGTAATATNLAAGTYTCMITDANACSITKNFTLTQPTALTATTSQTNVSCNGGSNGTATVSALGGTSSYTYSWTPSGGTNATATGLAAGTYICTITDANACSITKNFTLTQPTALTATTSQTNVACNGGTNGTATVSASGGTSSYTYSWTPSGGTNATATGLAAGTYICTITDANACSITKNFTLTQPTALTATTSQTNVACNGGTNGSATVSASGGTSSYTYSWTPSGGTNATATGLAAGTYICTITDANACSITKNFTLTQPTALTATTSQTNVSCNGASNGSATVTPSGGTSSYTYSWSPSGGTASTASGLTAGTYTCTITDANACTITKSVTILQPTLLTATTSQTNVSCNGGSNGTAMVSVSGGTPSYTYSWSPSGGTASTASGLTAGTYTCTITDANACITTQTVTITQPAALTATTSQTNVTCNGDADGSATITVSGGTNPYTYIWLHDGSLFPTVTELTAGTYACIITDTNGCTITQSVTITQPNTVTVDAGPATVTYCSDAIVPITATVSTATSNGFQGAYAPANWSFTNNNADGNVNTINAPASIIITGGNNSPFLGGNPGDTSYSMTFTTNTTVAFNWAYSTVDFPQYDFPQVIVNGAATTMQGYNTLGSNIQSGTMTVNVPADQTFAFNMHTLDNTEGSANVTISNLVISQTDVSYSWAATNGGSITGATNTASMIPATSGTYTVTATNIAGCTATDSVEVTINPLTAPTFAAIASICPGSTAPTLSTTSLNNITGTWLPALVDNMNSGTYTFTPDAGQCASTTTLDVTVTPQPAEPTVACYQTATWNSTSCQWDITGTQPEQPTIACYESATFNTTTCAWDVTGTQPEQPTIACYESATFNTTTCAWDITGTQPEQPTIACYETATFNTTTCIWDVTGTQPEQPTIACYETATFNTTTCAWNVTGTQPEQPTIACYETATFNTTTCIWDVTGTQPEQPTGSDTQTLLDTDATIGNLVVTPSTSIWYASEEDALAGTNALTSESVVTNGSTYYAVNMVNDCPSAPFAVTVTVTLANDGFDTINFNYFPNPTSNVLNIVYSKNIESVSVINLLGQIMFENKTNNTNVQVDLSNLPTATYFVKVNADGNEKTVKVIKQ